MPAGTVVAGQKLVVDIGGVVTLFTLDKKGMATPRVSGTTAKLSVKAKKGVVAAQTAKFTLSLTKGTLAQALADDGLVDQTLTTTLTVPVTLIFDGQQLKKAVPQSYKAVHARNGSTK